MAIVILSGFFSASNLTYRGTCGTFVIMRLTKPGNGVYIEFRDRRRRRKSVSLTVHGFTPVQLRDAFVRFYREHLQRKAG